MARLRGKNIIKRIVLLSFLLVATNTYGGGGFGSALSNAGAAQQGMDNAQQERQAIERNQQIIENMRLQNELLRRQLQSGSERRVCLTVNATIGTRITLPSGRPGVVTQLLGGSDGCPTAQFPIVGIIVDE